MAPPVQVTAPDEATTRETTPPAAAAPLVEVAPPEDVTPAPEATSPTAKAQPKRKLPKVSVPKVNLPKVALPKVNLPKATVPTVNLPKVNLPKVSVPKVNPPGSLRDTGGDELTVVAGPAAPTPVHPKFQLRRAQVAAGEARKRIRVRTVVLVALCAVTVVVLSLFSPFLDMDRLDVNGLEGEPAELVREASGLDPGTALFGLSPSEVRDRVEGLPWIAHAAVEVRWPDEVAVQVTPQRPVALVADGVGPADRIATSTGLVGDFEEMAPLVPFTGSMRTLRLDGWDDTPTPADPEDPDGPVREDHTMERALTTIARLGPTSSLLLGDATLNADGELTFVGAPGPIEGAVVSFGHLDDVPAKVQAM